MSWDFAEAVSKSASAAMAPIATVQPNDPSAGPGARASGVGGRVAAAGRPVEPPSPGVPGALIQ
ncbi:hypothetical protein HNQ79_002338 [Streptomyces candidus]|uniref:Uncharacterized protein n=1 Tax=Streptomyces candidus TaxID=67283 RepID=A0A7X0HDZ5_9ACTN|nr:hypothetical protein [Streptomyces candidus]GHH42801.1 hypothetical protein GCM10018773_27760 [Streptomyces candidus]